MKKIQPSIYKALRDLQYENSEKMKSSKKRKKKKDDLKVNDKRRVEGPVQLRGKAGPIRTQ